MIRRPIIGVTMGDPAGIGPEIVIKAWRNADLRAKARIIALGSADRMQRSFRRFGMTGRVHPISTVSEAIFHEDALDVLDVVDANLDSLNYGKVQIQAGQAAYEAVIASIDLTLAQEIDAIATAPLNKAALNQAGHAYSGHTELLAERTNTLRVTMMLVAGHCRVSHVSTHCSLAEAVHRVKRERILEVIRLTHESLTQMDISVPRIAVAGLNPHAGEGGLFGREEIEQIAPALEEAAAQGYRVTPHPVPPDTVFYRMYRQEAYDAVVAMYHDQGHIPLKMVGFSEGVNVTLGLPIIRTSVDHGTAFDIAGQGLADPTSMVRAIELAVTMAHGSGNT